MGDARKASLADVEVLTKLVADAVESTRSMRGGTLLAHAERTKAPAQRVVDAVGGPGRVAIAGEFEGVVLGVCLVHIEPTSGGSMATADELWVDPEAREVGIGEAMLEEALRWAREQRALGLDLEVLPGDRQMKNLCERLGLVARQLTMHVRIDDEAIELR